MNTKEKIEEILINDFGCFNDFTVDKLLDLFSVSGSVFVLQHKETRRIHGCFDTRDKAERYSNGSTNIAIMELEIA